MKFYVSFEDFIGRVRVTVNRGGMRLMRAVCISVKLGVVRTWSLFRSRYVVLSYVREHTADCSFYLSGRRIGLRKKKKTSGSQLLLNSGSRPILLLRSQYTFTRSNTCMKGNTTTTSKEIECLDLAKSSSSDEANNRNDHLLLLKWSS